MQCPKCQSGMERIHSHGVEVDRCTQCKGLWFDMLEEEELRAHAREVDVGDAALGAQHDPIDRIHCPVCGGQQTMVRMVDAQQPHIRFESCTICYGRFYDAGEFRDLAELTLAERFGLR